MADVWLFIKDSSKVARLDNLRNAATPGFVNNATVTLTLTDQTTGTPLAGQTWPVTLTYVAGSNGRYDATLDYDIVVTEGQRLLARYTVVHGMLQRQWIRDVLVVRGE